MKAESPRAHDLAGVGVLMLLVTAVFFDVLFLGNSLGAGDLPQYHFGLEHVFRQLVLHGEFPWWNRLIEAGQPMAANPAYEVYYPLQWLVLLPGFVFGFKLHIVVHYYLAALGMFALCRSLGMRVETAVIAGAAFGIGGPLMATAGYLPFLFALTWIPWMLLFAWRFHRDGRVADFALAAAAFAMQLFIGEPVLLAESAAILLVGALLVRRLPWAIAILAAGVALGAVQVIPAVDHARDSVRSIPLDYPAVSAFSSPVARPLELLVPTKSAGARRFVGAQRPFITNIYLGTLLALLALAGLVSRVRGWQAVAGFMVVAWVIAIGSHTPLLRMLYDVRLFSSIRYPEKFLFGALFVVVLFGAAAVDRLLEGDSRVRRAAIVVSAGAAIGAAVCAAVTSPAFVQWSWRISAAIPPAIVQLDRAEWSAAALRAGLVTLIVLFLRGKRLAVTLAVFALVELTMANAGGLLRVPDRYYGEAPPLLAELPQPSERVFHQVAFERALGLRSMRGGAYDTRWLIRNEMVPYIPSAWGRATFLSYDFDETGLFASRRLRVAADIARERGDRSWPLAFMAISNAPWRVVPVAAEEAVRRAGGDLERLTTARVVREPIAAPRYAFVTRLLPCIDVFDCARQLATTTGEGVALVPPALARGAVGPGRVLRVAERPSSADLDVTADSRAFLAISVTYHKYWRAWIDGREASLVPSNLAYQGLFVPAGRHHVRLVYRNPLVPVGAAVTVVAMLALMAGALVDARRRRSAQAIVLPAAS